jgi:hypothetical protein
MRAPVAGWTELTAPAAEPAPGVTRVVGGSSVE